MDNLMELLKTRRTYRRFEQKAIDQEIIDEILLAARYASSAPTVSPFLTLSLRMQTRLLRCSVIQSGREHCLPNRDSLRKMSVRYSLLQLWRTMNINKNCDTDAGLAISNMTLAAWNRGVGSCMIGACDKPTLSKMFGLNENQVLHTVVAFGYPSHVSHIVDAENPEKVKYYLDENRDYVVPKRKLEDVVTYL